MVTGFHAGGLAGTDLGVLDPARFGGVAPQRVPAGEGHGVGILVAGLMAVHLDIDTAVAIIRGSDTVDNARIGLQARFTLDAEQADYVLAMQLRQHQARCA